MNVKGKKADAEKRLREFLTAEDRGLPIQTEKITTAEWLSRWMSEVVIPNRKVRTVERYEGIIKNHIVPVVGHVPISRLGPTHIKKVHSNLAEKGLSASTVECCHWVMSAALTYALRMEVVYRNPVQAVEPPKVVKKEVQPPLMQTVNKILCLSREDRSDMYPALWLATYTGMRRGEVLGLHWSNVELNSGQLHVSQALVRTNRLGLILDTPKSPASRRVIDIDDETVNVLCDHKVAQMESRLMLTGSYKDNDLVFANDIGGLPNPMRLTRALGRYAERAGAGNMHLHDLRHFHASVLLQSGMNIVLVSKRLGHSSVSMTLDIYGHLLPGWQKEAATAFAKAMSAAK